MKFSYIIQTERIYHMLDILQIKLKSKIFLLRKEAKGTLFVKEKSTRHSTLFFDDYFTRIFLPIDRALFSSSETNILKLLFIRHHLFIITKD